VSLGEQISLRKRASKKITKSLLYRYRIVYSVNTVPDRHRLAAYHNKHC